MRSTTVHTVCALMVALLLASSAVADIDSGIDTQEDRPQVGLVLAGGGAKGFAHIGVLEVLEEAGVPIDFVVGTSMGAVIGGLYAAGRSPQELAEAAVTIDWSDAFQDRGERRLRSMRRKADDRRLVGRLGVGVGFDGFALPLGAIQGQRLTQLLRAHLGDAGMIEDFDDLPIPFRAIATDLETGQALAPEHGDLALAIRASMSIPGLVAPVRWENRLLADGGLRSNLPIEVAREMGADIIVAIDVGEMTPTDTDFESALQVMDQAIRLMIRQNVHESMRTLEPDDLYLRIDTGDIPVADFARAGEVIQRGATTARAHIDELEELAMLAGGPASRARDPDILDPGHAPPAARPVIREIRLDNRSTLDDRLLLRHIDINAGDRFDREHVERAVSRIHGLGYFERVDYRLRAVEEDRADLELLVEPRSWGPNYLRFGLALEDDFDTRSTYRAAVSYLATEVNAFGAEIQADLELGSDPRVFTEFWQPLAPGSSWFVAPRAMAGRSDVRLFAEGERIGDVRLSQRELGLHLGREIALSGELRVGIEGGDGETEALIGDIDIESREFTTGRYVARALWDGLDDADFPSTGSTVRLEWKRSTESLGADDPYTRIALDAGQAFSHGRNRWFVSARAGTVRGTDAPPVQALHALGGFLNLGGYRRDELTGSEMALAQLTYLREVAGYRTLGGLPLFLGAAIETGNVWSSRDERDFDDLITSGTLIAATNTAFGPLYLAWGTSDDGTAAAYLSLGRTF